MSRYRPPAPKRSAYITPEGAQAIRDEIDTLWKTERPVVTRAVTAAAALGDRSENADYHYGKKKLRQIDSRVRYLAKRLDELIIVEPTEHSDEKVYFGAWVTLEDEEGEEVEYRIVGPDESNAEKQAISMDSPIGKNLLGRSLGDSVKVKRPKDVATYEIVALRYEE